VGNGSGEKIQGFRTTDAKIPRQTREQAWIYFI